MDFEALRYELDLARAEQAANMAVLSSVLQDGYNPHAINSEEPMHQRLNSTVALQPVPKLSWGSSKSRSEQGKPSDRSEPSHSSLVQGIPRDATSSDLVRKHAFKEVLSLLLGGSGNTMLDHIQLCPESVAAIIEEKKHRAVVEALNEAEQRAAKEFAEKLARSLKEAQGMYDKELSAKVADFDAKYSALKAQLANLHRNSEASKTEKKQLEGKLAQMGRDKRLHNETIKDLQEKLSTAEKTAEKHARSVTKALADADKARAEGERRAREGEARGVAAEAKLAACLEAQTQEAKASKKARATADHQLMELTSELHAVKTMFQELTVSSSASEKSHNEAMALVLQAQEDFRVTVLSSIDNTHEGMLDIVDSSQQDIQALHKEVLDLISISSVSSLHYEVQKAREILVSEFGVLQAAINQSLGILKCSRDKALAHESELVNATEALEKFGGIEGLSNLQQDLEDERAKVKELQINLQLSGSLRSQLEATRLQLEAEVRLCSQIQAELRRELSSVECQLETSKANLREAVIRAEEAESRSAGALEETRCARESADAMIQSSETKIKSMIEEKLKLESLHISVCKDLDQSRADSKRLSEDIVVALNRGAIAAATAIKELRSRYFCDPVFPAQSSVKPALNLSSCDVAPHADLHGISNVCSLSHNQLVDYLQIFIERQANVLSSGHNSERVKSDGPFLSAHGVDSMMSSDLCLTNELLWLEGSILLLLVEFRRQERLLTGSHSQGAVTNPGFSRGETTRTITPLGSNRGKLYNSGVEMAGSGIGGSPARSLASQMMRALASERTELQRKLALKSAKEAPAPFTSYAPLRRSISERTQALNPPPHSANSHGPLSDALRESLSAAASLNYLTVTEKQHKKFQTSLVSSASLGLRHDSSDPNPSADGIRVDGGEPSYAEIVDRTVLIEESIPLEVQDARRESYDVDEVMSILSAQSNSLIPHTSWRGGWQSMGIRSLPRQTSRGAHLIGRPPAGQGPSVCRNGLAGAPLLGNVTQKTSQRHRSADGRI